MRNWEISDAGLIKQGHGNILSGAYGPGTVFYVDGTSGLDTNNGLTRDTPLLTVTAALAKCTNSKGDVIQILRNSPTSPPATETFPIAVNKANVTIRGILSPRGAMLSDSGIGSHTQNKACFEIGAHYVTIEDLYIGVDNLGSNGGIIEFNGTNSYFGTTIRRCTFDTQYISAYGIYLPYDQPYLLVEDCVFGRADIAGFTTAGISIGNCTGGMIRRNVFNGVTGVGINIGAGCGNLTVLDNRFLLDTETEGDAITIALGAVGNVFDGNRGYFGNTNDPAANPFKDGSGASDNHWGLNYKGITATYPA